MNAWDAADDADFRGPLDVTRAVTAIVDARGVVIGWSPAAEHLLGYTPRDVLGRGAEILLAGGPGESAGPGRAEPWAPGRQDGGARVRSGAIELRHRDGHVVRMAATVCPVTHAYGGADPAVVLVAAELDTLRQWEAHQAMLRGLVAQSPVGLTIYDTDLRVSWANAVAREEFGAPLSKFADQNADEIFPAGEVVSAGHPPSLDRVMRRVLDTGESVADLHYRAGTPADPENLRVWSCSYYRLQDERGEPIGVCEESVDITDRYRAQQRLALLVRAGARIGASLDVAQTARELAEVSVPHFADEVTVDVLEPVLEGKEPLTGPVVGAFAGWRLVRVHGGQDAARPIDYAPASPQARSLSSGRPLLDGDANAHMYVPLRARGSTMGLVTLSRDRNPEPFDVGELALADELAARTAVCIDNARRYTREHTAALTLQRSLLPRHLPQQTAVEVAVRYLPADGRVGVGGDWFDVIPLSGTRVGLVVGDVVGHGLGAAATMGRLRTTVRALAQLDLDPDELLARLDDQVGAGSEDESGPDDEGVGVTCLYAVYDPVSRCCRIARAGHLLPALVGPDGGVTFPELPPGPPLGLGGLPFESRDLDLAEGSLLALFTDGLVETRDADRGTDIDRGLVRLARVLAQHKRPLEELCDEVLSTVPPGPAADDAALLLARTRVLGAQQIGVWELDSDPVVVAGARAEAMARLDDWGLDELAFTTELIVSELVTNAIRHAAGPIHLRLIRDRTLICEVSDTGHTSPHLRHAAGDDEGGRGLFLVAQMAQRWGTRYTPTGKTIWTEVGRLPAG